MEILTLRKIFFGAGWCRSPPLAQFPLHFSSISFYIPRHKLCPDRCFRLLNQHVFQWLKTLVAKKRPCVSQRKKKIYIYIMLWQNLYNIVIISLGETLEGKYVPFVAKMMAIIRNISVTKPLVVLWTMFFAISAQHSTSVWLYLGVFSPFCYDVILLSIITWLSVVGKNIKKLMGQNDEKRTLSSLAKSKLICLVAWHDSANKYFVKRI